MTGQRFAVYLERIGRGMIGLLVSAGFGALVGIQTGALVGCIVGTVVPVLGNAIGAAVGAGVGALAGLPTGILLAVLRGRAGCRLSGAAGALLVPLVVLSEEGALMSLRAGDRSDSWPLLVLSAAFAVVGVAAGDWVWRRRERDTAPKGMWAAWRRHNERWGLGDLTLADRLLSALLLTLPAWAYLLSRHAL